MPKTLLFVTHDCSRTGAPIVLSHLAKWVSENSDCKIMMLAFVGGELLPEFQQNYDCIVPFSIRFYRWFIAHFPHSKQFKFLEKTILFIIQLELWVILKPKKLDLVYLNTVVTAPFIKNFKSLNVPIITHIHELRFFIENHITSKDIDDLVKYTDLFITASKLTQENFLSLANIDTHKAKLIYECISPPRVAKFTTSTKQLKSELKLTDKEFIVGSCGTMDWRKGVDLFIQLANLARQKYPNRPICFAWVGSSVPYEIAKYKYDIAQLDLSNVRLIPSQSDPYPYFGIFDVFALLSREDPYPLVCLENAALGTPILCFDKGNGTRELVEDDAGFIIPYLNLEAMLEKICLLQDNPNLRTELGRNAKKKVLSKHLVEHAGPQVLEIIQSFIKD